MTSETDNKVEAAEPDAAHMLRLLLSVARGPSSGDRSYTIVIGQRDLDRMKSLASLDRTACEIPDFLKRQTGELPPAPMPAWRDDGREGRREGAEEDPEPAQEVAGLVEGLRPEVIAFAHLMEAQLKANDHKPGWKGENPWPLLDRLFEEARELGDELQPSSRSSVDAWRARLGAEAADVANFAMMIADVCGSLTALASSPSQGGETL